MFKIGDNVILRWPETNSHGDTMNAVDFGYLTKGATYKVLSVRLRINSPNEILLAGNNGMRWNVGADCLCKAGTKRNLPEWF